MKGKKYKVIVLMEGICMLISIGLVLLMDLALVPVRILCSLKQFLHRRQSQES